MLRLPPMQRTLDRVSHTAVRLALCAAMAVSVSWSVACDDGGFTQIPEPEKEPEPTPEPEPVAPPPPVYPLKTDDIVELSIGARTEPCDLGEGLCDRSMQASYTIDQVSLNEETNRWDLTAYYLYTLTKDQTSFQSIQRLFWSKVAPFGEITDVQGTQDGTAPFFTDVPLTDEHMTANGFPFFHFESEYANQPGSAYQVASTAFTARIRSIDPEAEIENQAAAAKFEAFFRDDLGPEVYLHKILVEFHQFGFVCKVDEGVVDWDDGMERNASTFGTKTPRIVNQFNNIFLRRDGTRYRCSCFTGDCQTTDGSGLCLDPKDPDAEPSADACGG